MTPEQKAKFFSTECRRFINFFGLHEWEVSYDVHNISARGMCFTNGITSTDEGDGQVATISCGEDWIGDADTGKDELSLTAFHEVMELLLTKMRDYALNHDVYISGREIDDEVHKIIMRFENRIYPLIKRKS